jgi:hypothetical protein
LKCRLPFVVSAQFSFGLQGAYSNMANLTAFSSAAKLALNNENFQKYNDYLKEYCSVYVEFA